ncbi:MAG: hypothetical protein M3Z19_05990 [Chloroflexota bacterium]|nr:hypothetical protein [Chloroflexota bacterium]
MSNTPVPPKKSTSAAVSPRTARGAASHSPSKRFGNAAHRPGTAEAAPQKTTAAATGTKANRLSPGKRAVTT